MGYIATPPPTRQVPCAWKSVDPSHPQLQDPRSPKAIDENCQARDMEISAELVVLPHHPSVGSGFLNVLLRPRGAIYPPHPGHDPGGVEVSDLQIF